MRFMLNHTTSKKQGDVDERIFEEARGRTSLQSKCHMPSFSSHDHDEPAATCLFWILQLDTELEGHPGKLVRFAIRGRVWHISSVDQMHI